MVSNLLIMKKSLDFERMISNASTSERLTSMELEELKNGRGELYSFRLKGVGDVEGLSDIRIKQLKGDIILEDHVSLPKENSGFERDIVLLKKCMYEDLGCVAAGDVRDLGYRRDSIGYTLSFKVSKEKARKALHYYIDTSLKVMGDFFRENEEIYLAFSLARERIGQ